MLQKGEQFPIFKLENQDGTVITNDTLKGKKAIVYFYPRDNTPTCTTEACDFRDNLEMFNDLDVAVYGISGDSKKKHQNFIEKHGLNFDLLVDEDFKLAKRNWRISVKKIIWQRKYGHCKNDFYNR